MHKKEKLEQKGRKESVLHSFGQNSLIKEIVDSAPCMIYLLDLDQAQLSYVNESAEAILGYSTAQLLSEPGLFGRFVHTEDSRNLDKYLEVLSVSQGAESAQTELRLKHRDGDYRWFRLYGRGFRQDDKPLEKLTLGVAVDIHASKSEMGKSAVIEDWFQSLLENSPKPVMALKSVRNAKGKISDFEYLFVNGKSLQSTHRKNLNGKFLGKEFPGAKKNGLIQKYAQVVETGEALEEDISFEDDGFAFFWHVSVNKLGDGCLVNYFDVTEEQKADQRLAERELQWRFLIDNTPDVVTRWDRQIRLVYANIALESKTGVANETLIGKNNIEMGHPPEVAGPWMDRLREVFETGKPLVHNNSFPTPDGMVYFQSRIVPERNEEGEVETVLAVAQDITELRKKEEGLTEAIQKLTIQNYLFEQAEKVSGTGSWVWHLNTNEIYFSGNCYRIYGLAPQSTPTSWNSFVAFAHPEDREILQNMITGLVLGEEASTIDYRILPAAGDYRYLRMISQTVLNPGNTRSVIGTLQDITDRKSAERKLSRLAEEEISGLNKRLLLMKRELDSLSSELKNLASVASNHYGETLRQLYISFELIINHDAKNLSNSGRANLRRAQAAVQKMKLLTDDISKYLFLYNAEISFETIDPEALVHEVIAHLDNKVREAGATIAFDGLTPFTADGDLFVRLLSAIIDNSIKFGKPQVPPDIRISAERAENADALYMARNDTVYTVLTVSDNGIGFDAGDNVKVFELFKRLQPDVTRGSGVGLAICKKIMELHGGFILADGKAGEGTSIRCYFPDRPLPQTEL